MFAQMMAAASGGGSVKSGTTEAAAQNTTITIDTGVPNIKHFVWMAKVASANGIQTVEYYDEVFPNKYNASFVGFSATTANTAFGTAATNVGMLTADTDIASGIIKIKMPNTVYGNVNAGVWFAE